MQRTVLVFAAALLLGSAAHAVAADTVRDSRASLIDVTARQKELAHASSPRVLEAIHHLDSCRALPEVAPPQGRIVIPHHYLKGSDGPINPAEHEATAPYNALERRVTAGMNQFVANGSAEEAMCAQQQIHAWAVANALLDYDATESSQAWFQVEWTLSSIAVSESVLVNERTLDASLMRSDIAWMDRVAHRMIDFEKQHPAHNNHHAWRALAAVATGVVAKDDALFGWGTNVFREEVDQIDPRGAFPLEMQRKENSIHYQAFALQPLIPIAELAARQGVDLYAYRSLTGKGIQDAIKFLTRAVADPDIVSAYTDVRQKLLPLSKDFYSFGEFYVRRFPARNESLEMRKDMSAPTFATRIGGSTTVLAADTGGAQ